MNYGKHLLVEVICQNKKYLSSKVFIKKFILDLISQLNLIAMAPPKLFKFPPPGGGVTGFCVIAESHIAIHTWPEKNYFTFDIFSCRDFNEKNVENIIRRSFKIKTMHQQVLERGLSINFKN